MNHIMSERPYHPILTNQVFQSLLSTKTIHVIAPASGLSPQEIAKLQQLPFSSTLIFEDIASDEIPYHANTDEMRLAQLKAVLYDPRPNQIIWCLRGGYGSARLIDGLQDLKPPLHEKMVIGYSDLTALHLFLSQQWGWRTVHGAGFAQLLNAKWDLNNFMRLACLIEDPVLPQLFSPLVPLNTLAQQSKLIQGKMNGGNLTLVESSIGTSWQINTAGCILFLEEVGEKGYRIDRSLLHLKQAKLLNDVEAIVFGQCLSEDEAMVTFALNRFAEESVIPVFQSQQFGHDITNYPIIYQSLGSITCENDVLVLRMQVG